MSGDLYSELVSSQRRYEDNQRLYQEAGQMAMRMNALKRRDELCLSEFSSMPSSTQFYRGVGKAYVVQSQKELTEKLQQRIEENAKQAEQAKGKQHYYEAQCKSSQKKLEDLLKIVNSEAAKNKK